ncbi:MAG: DUF1330 domain-containing protein [bacterium]|nr:DUF1330 domain-containing protein [bacterium]
MTCYFLARITVHDEAGYARYLEGTDPVLARYGAEVLAVDEAPVVLEGQWPGTRTVLISFPDEASARAWYDSPEYQAIAQHRFRAASADAVFVRGRN